MLMVVTQADGLQCPKAAPYLLTGKSAPVWGREAPNMRLPIASVLLTAVNMGLSTCKQQLCLAHLCYIDPWLAGCEAEPQMLNTDQP